VIPVLCSILCASMATSDVWQLDRAGWQPVSLQVARPGVDASAARAVLRVSAPEWTGSLNTVIPWPANLPLSPHLRYDVSGAARGTGELPKHRAVRLVVQGTRPDGERTYLATRRRIGLWRLTEQFQRFHVQSQILDPWPAESVQIQFSPYVPIQPAAIELADLRVDVAYPPEMLAPGRVILLDTEHALPIRFATWADKGLKSWDPSARENARLLVGSVYHLYLPDGIRIVSAGDDPEAWGPGGSRSTKDGIYALEVVDRIRIGGRIFNEWVLTPTHAKYNDDWVGPVYLDTSLPAGTETDIYYRTHWQPGSYEGDWDHWSAGALRKMKVEVRTFPQPGRPRHLVTSLGWMAASSARAFPDFLETNAALGFSYVPSLRMYSGFAHRRNESEPYPDIAPQEVAFFAQARCLGYGVLAMDSPFNYHGRPETYSIDPATGKPITDRRNSCPAFGLPSVDESRYDVSTETIEDRDAQIYTDQLNSLRAYLAVVEPEYMMLDVEAWGEGAKIALGEDPDHPSGCQRCNDYLANHRSKPGHAHDGMQDALIAMGVERIDDLERVLTLAGVPVPRMGYYHSAGEFAYQQVIQHAAIAASAPSRIGHWPIYSYHPSRVRDKFQPLQQEAFRTGTSFLPILNPSPRGIPPYKEAATLYDRLNETLGSGAPGVEYWPYYGWVSNDFYYHASAIDHMLSVEHLLVNSEPLGELETHIVSDWDGYDVRASAVRKDNEYVILISTYGPRGNLGLMDEDPVWRGDVTVTLPRPVSGAPLRTADGLRVGPEVENSHEVTIDFRPGVEGAKTALFYLCDATSGPCDGLASTSESGLDRSLPSRPDGTLQRRDCGTRSGGSGERIRARQP
jgi:hypothetical protein